MGEAEEETGKRGRPEVLEADKVRRARFVAWFSQEYGNKDDEEARRKFMRDSKFTKGRVSQIFDETQPFGDRAVLSIALRLGRKSAEEVLAKLPAKRRRKSSPAAELDAEAEADLRELRPIWPFIPHETRHAFIEANRPIAVHFARLTNTGVGGTGRVARARKAVPGDDRQRIDLAAVEGRDLKLKPAAPKKTAKPRGKRKP